jgi:hypothetical protein
MNDEDIWVYDLGKWTYSYFSNFGLKKLEAKEEFNDFLHKNNFYTEGSTMIGEEFGRNIIFFKSKCLRKWFADISISDICEMIFIPNAPSRLMFLKEYESFFEIKKPKFIRIEDGYHNINNINNIIIRGGGEKENRTMTIGGYDSNGEYIKIFDDQRWDSGVDILREIGINDYN